MNLEEINILNACSEGIIEEGVVMINFKGRDITLLTEEFNNKYNAHSFKVFLSDIEDNDYLNVVVDDEMEILDKEFVSLIHDAYQNITSQTR
jgi:hypothetical protein